MRQDLKDKVAIVTGGANGLGRAMVELFIAEGARVVIADRNAEAGHALAASLGAAGYFRQTDVASGEDVKALVEDTVSHFGGLHVLVNNAAIPSAMHPHFLDEELDDFDRVMRVNMLGVMIGTQRAARHMARTGGGSIINISATSGIQAGFGVISYRVAKAGVIQFTKSVAIDLAANGIRVNCIAPGNINTAMNAFTPPGMSDEAVLRWRAELDAVRMASQPLKRKGVASDVAEAALYLASDRAAQVTGVVLPVDGGVTAGDSVNHLQAILDARNRNSPS